MSQENVGFVLRFFRALNRHDERALIELVHPDVEFTSLIQEVEGTFHGHDGFRDYLSELFAAFPDWRGEVEDIRPAAEKLVVKVHVRASGTGSGASVDLIDWQALVVRDGRAAWWAFFRSETEALKALGLEG
jgi:ketosteroid isomerase-like protein